VQRSPLAPGLVARFVADIAPLGIEQVWAAVQEVSREHYTKGFADPTLGHPVATAISELAAIRPPRSWPKEEQAQFRRLPYDLQIYVVERELGRDRIVRQSQAEVSKLKEKANDEKQDVAA